jgi:hypothetical protein
VNRSSSMPETETSQTVELLLSGRVCGVGQQNAGARPQARMARRPATAAGGDTSATAPGVTHSARRWSTLPEAKVRGAAAGLHVTVELSQGDHDAAIRTQARARRVALEMIREFHPTSHSPHPTLVLGYGQMGVPTVRAGVSELVDAVRATGHPMTVTPRDCPRLDPTRRAHRRGVPTHDRE